MQAPAVQKFLARAFAERVPTPAVVIEEGSPTVGNGAIHLPASADWGVVAKSVIAYLFDLARTGELPAGTEGPVLEALTPYLSVRCGCGQVAGFPPTCSRCYKPLKP